MKIINSTDIRTIFNNLSPENQRKAIEYLKRLHLECKNSQQKEEVQVMARE